MTSDEVQEHRDIALASIDNTANIALQLDRVPTPLIRSTIATAQLHADHLESKGGEAGRGAAVEIRESVRANLEPFLVARSRGPV